MADQARIGYGAKFFIGALEVGGLTDISAPSLSRDTVDTTDMGSADGFREFIAGLSDGGEVSIEFNFYPRSTSASNQHLLRQNLEAGPNQTAQAFSIRFPANEEVDFNGFVTGFEPAVPLEDKMTGSTTIKITGKPTWVDAFTT